MHLIFSHCGLGSPLFIPLGGVRGKYWKKRKNEIHPICRGGIAFFSHCGPGSPLSIFLGRVGGKIWKRKN